MLYVNQRQTSTTRTPQPKAADEYRRQPTNGGVQVTSDRGVQLLIDGGVQVTTVTRSPSDNLWGTSANN